MDTTTFYATAAGLCFTLLGFWWVVVQFRYAELTRNPGVRWFALLVALQFIIPGLLSLASLLATGLLWRLAFGLGGLIGVAAVVVAIARGAERRAPLHPIGRWAWLGLPLYGLVAAVAALPDLIRTATGLDPLQVEGFLLLVILLVGVMLAWLLFTEPPADGA